MNKMQKSLPDFVVVGAMKSGSTSLLNALGDHPEVFMPKKEVHFFNKYHHLGPEWYIQKFTSSSKSHKVIGEKTPTYSYLPEIPERMHALIPQAKLIWILREPVARAYSNYWHAAWRGKEDLTFEAAVECEHIRIKQDVYKGYLARSRYADQIENYLKFYSIDRMKFVLLDDLVKDPQGTLKDVLTFLDIDASTTHWRSMNIGNKTNYTPRNLTLHAKARTWITNDYFFRFFTVFNRKVGVPKIDKSLHQDLKRLYVEDNKRLETLIKRDLSSWN